jgi:hypothetical protein
MSKFSSWLRARFPSRIRAALRKEIAKQTDAIYSQIKENLADIIRREHARLTQVFITGIRIAESVPHTLLPNGFASRLASQVQDAIRKEVARQTDAISSQIKENIVEIIRREHARLTQISSTSIRTAESIPRTLFPNGFVFNPCVFEYGPNPVIYKHLLPSGLVALDHRVCHVPMSGWKDDKAGVENLVSEEDDSGTIAEEMELDVVDGFLLEEEMEVDVANGFALDTTAGEAAKEHTNGAHNMSSLMLLPSAEENPQAPDSFKCCEIVFRTAGALKYVFSLVQDRSGC